MSDAINPSHYDGFTNGAQPVDIAENLTFNAGNALKYLARAGRTDGNTKGDSEQVIEDLRKAEWYIQREIQRLGGVRGVNGEWIGAVFGANDPRIPL